jgi:hypothetical protein
MQAHDRGHSHAHRHEHTQRHAGETAPRRRGRRGMLAQLVGWAQAARGRGPDERGLPRLPADARRGDRARPPPAAPPDADHRRAAAAATTQLERAASDGQWLAADAWGHRALWHYEQAGMELHATRAARRIADVRLLGGDAAGARRYYAEAISEARDLGAEREEGLAALGLGRAHLELRRVGEARRLAQIAIDLLERCGAPSEEIAAALALRGTEKQVTHEEQGA